MNLVAQLLRTLSPEALQQTILVTDNWSESDFHDGPLQSCRRNLRSASGYGAKSIERSVASLRIVWVDGAALLGDGAGVFDLAPRVLDAGGGDRQTSNV